MPRRDLRALRPGGASWSIVSGLAVGLGVAFAVLLMSVSYGARHGIDGRLSTLFLQRSSVGVGTINAILRDLTVVVTAAMVLQTGATTFTVGVILMRLRRREIAIRRQDGVVRRRLVRDFAREMTRPVLVGACAGEAAGLLAGEILRRFTVLPVRFNLVSIALAFPVTVVVAMVATIIPAYRASGVSPAMVHPGG